MAHWLALCPNSIFLRRLSTERMFYRNYSDVCWKIQIYLVSGTIFHECNQDTTLNLFLLQNISKWLKVVFTVNLCFKKITL